MMTGIDGTKEQTTPVGLTVENKHILPLERLDGGSPLTCLLLHPSLSITGSEINRKE